MAIITPTPLVMKNAVLTFGADDFAAALSSITLTPNAAVVTFRGLKPTAQFSDVTSPTWTAELTYAQDWDNDNSLSMYLFEHQGDAVEASFYPEAGGREWTVTLLITPGAIGGAVDTHATATVSLGVIGQPIPGEVV